MRTLHDALHVARRCCASSLNVALHGSSETTVQRTTLTHVARCDADPATGIGINEPRIRRFAVSAEVISPPIPDRTLSQLDQVSRSLKRRSARNGEGSLTGRGNHCGSPISQKMQISRFSPVSGGLICTRDSANQQPQQRPGNVIYANSKNRLAAICRSLTGVGSTKSLTDWSLAGCPLNKGPDGYLVCEITRWLFARRADESGEESWSAKRSRERFLREQRKRIAAREKLLPVEAVAHLVAEAVIATLRELQSLETELVESALPEPVDGAAGAVRARLRKVRLEARQRIEAFRTASERPHLADAILAQVQQETGINLAKNPK